MPKYFQPNAPQGSFEPGRYLFVCPRDGTTCQLIGSGDFQFLCPNCAWQFRIDGTPRVDNALQAPPFVMRPPDPGDESRIDYSEPPFDDL